MISCSGYYHITLRGNGKQIIFEDDDDYKTFLTMLGDALATTKIVVIAWCLMSNHAHLCLRDDGEDLDALSKAMQGLQSRYAGYFNAKTGHVGHVFQGRFSSAPVEDEAYLLETIRYIHNNPAKAGLGFASDYRWSSYGEYVGEATLCDTSMILEELGGPKGFEEFVRSGSQDGFRSPAERRVRISDDEATCIATAIYPDLRLDDVKSLPVEQRDSVLIRLRKEGFSARQLERLTGIGRNVIIRVTRA